MLTWVLWAIVAAACAHVAEEYGTGFLEWARRLTGLPLSPAEFVVVNVLFIAFAVSAAAGWPLHPIVRFSVPGLIFVNAWLHVGVAIRTRRYAPGVISAVALYLPLASTAFVLAVRGGGVTLAQAAMALLLGAAWHAVPPLVHMTYRTFTR